MEATLTLSISIGFRSILQGNSCIYRPFVCNSLSLSAQGDGMCSWQGCLQCLLCVWCLFIVWKPLTSPSSLLGSVNRSNVTKYVKNLSMIHVLMQTSMFNMLSSYIHYFIAGCLGKLSTVQFKVYWKDKYWMKSEKKKHFGRE